MWSKTEVKSTKKCVFESAFLPQFLLNLFKTNKEAKNLIIKKKLFHILEFI